MVVARSLAVLAVGIACVVLCALVTSRGDATTLLSDPLLSAAIQEEDNRRSSHHIKIQRTKDSLLADAMQAEQRQVTHQQTSGDLPAFGSNEYDVDLARSKLDLARAHLKLFRAQKKRDEELAKYAEFSENNGYPKLHAEKTELKAKTQQEIAEAKRMEHKARVLSAAVIKELGVKNGKYNVQQWYQSHAARKSSLQSTHDVNKARDEWTQAEKDEAMLHQLEKDPVFSQHDVQLSKSEVALRINQRQISKFQAQVAGAEKTVTELEMEAPPPTGGLAVIQKDDAAPHKKAVASAKMTTAQKTARGREEGLAAANIRKAKEDFEDIVQKHKSMMQAHKNTFGSVVKAVDQSFLSAEGGGARTSQLASGGNILRGKPATAKAAQMALRTAASTKVADLVYQSAEDEKVPSAFKQHVPLLERKMIWNW